MKTCNNCKHYSYGHCRISIGKVDLILGTVIVLPLEAKDARLFESYCGSEGKWYEEKEKA